MTANGARVTAWMRAATPLRVKRALTRTALRVQHPAELRLYDKHHRSTMIPLPEFIDNLALCRLLAGVDGDLVECGVWRGGMSAALAERCAQLSGRERTSVLFDSFAGLPSASAERDGHEALVRQQELVAHHTNLAVDEARARAAMAASGAACVRIHAGWFFETVPKYAREAPRIALLRLDGDLYDSTTTCLDALFPHVVERGLLVVDDYGVWEGATRAVHDYLSREHRPEPIRRTPAGVAYLVKGAGG